MTLPVAKVRAGSDSNDNQRARVPSSHTTRTSCTAHRLFSLTRPRLRPRLVVLWFRPCPFPRRRARRPTTRLTGAQSDELRRLSHPPLNPLKPCDPFSSYAGCAESRRTARCT